MAKKKSIKIKITGSNATTTISGRHLLENVPNESVIQNLTGESQNLDIALKDIEGNVKIAGENIISFASPVAQMLQVTQPLDELSVLLSGNLKQKVEIDDLHSIITGLKEQAIKPQAERHPTKISWLLSSVSFYIAVTELTTPQAERAQQLLELTRKLFNLK